MYAPVGSVVFNRYWQEHYTVLSHNENGSVTVKFHGDGRFSNSPREERVRTHFTPLGDDRIVG